MCGMRKLTTGDVIYHPETNLIGVFLTYRFYAGEDWILADTSSDIENMRSLLSPENIVILSKGDFK